jgi:hypothetical protein
MFRTLLTLLLTLTIVAEASAQSTPAGTTKTTGRTKATPRRPAPKASPTKRTVANTTANTTAQPVKGIGAGGNGVAGSTETADGKGQNVYAAPGMPVNIDNPKKVEGYNGPAPTKPRSGTTLTPR